MPFLLVQGCPHFIRIVPSTSVILIGLIFIFRGDFDWHDIHFSKGKN
jgi:hypothetical protein